MSTVRAGSTDILARVFCTLALVAGFTVLLATAVGYLALVSFAVLLIVNYLFGVAIPYTAGSLAKMFLVMVASCILMPSGSSSKDD